LAIIVGDALTIHTRRKKKLYSAYFAGDKISLITVKFSYYYSFTCTAGDALMRKLEKRSTLKGGTSDIEAEQRDSAL
jgi:hypothetical protein